MDRDRSGEIDAAELSEALCELGNGDGPAVDEAEAAELIAYVDKDGNGHLDFAEFVAMMTHLDKKAGESGDGGCDGRTSRDERLAHCFDLVRVAETMEQRYKHPLPPPLSLSTLLSPRS